MNSLSDFDRRISTAWTLPSRFYTDPAALAAEKERVFARTWQLVGSEGRAKEPGQFFTTSVAGEPLLCVGDDFAQTDLAPSQPRYR